MSLVRPARREHATGDAVRSVVVLTPWFPNTPGDRNGSYIYQSATAVARKGVAVSILVCRPSAPGVPAKWIPEWARGSVDVARFAGQFDRVVPVRYPALPGGALRTLSNFSQRLRVRPTLEALARGTRASLIHAQTEGMAPLAVEVARNLQLPAIVTIHGINTDRNYLHSKGQRATLVPALRQSDRIVLVGRSLTDVFADYLGRADHLRVVPNGVQLPKGERTATVLSRTPVRFVSVSNLHEGKGIDLVLDALVLLDKRGIRGWAYAVIGDGAEKDALLARARRHGLGDRITFLGALPHEKVFDSLLESDVFVLPSYREAFGIAYLEAMACGLPAIGIRGQGPEAFIEHGVSGFLIEPRSVAAIADCLCDILADVERARRVGDRARSRAQEFTWDAHAERLMEVYQEATSP